LNFFKLYSFRFQYCKKFRTKAYLRFCTTSNS